MFDDRCDAGKQLASLLLEYKNTPNAIVIALPRGGVVVGFEVAKALNLPLDITCPRKISAPGNRELAIGAITETGSLFLEGSHSFIPEEYLQKAIEKEKQVATNRLNLYRKNLPKQSVEGKLVILVDDGVATGSTLFAAIQSIKSQKAKEIVVAIPVAPKMSFEKIKKEVSKAVVVILPTPFYAVGQFYQHFEQITDERVISLLQESIKPLAC